MNKLTFPNNYNNLISKLEFKERLEEDLNLVISEASIKGVEKAEFMEICDRIFSMMKSISIEDK